MCGLIAGCAQQQHVFKVTLQVSASCSQESSTLPDSHTSGYLRGAGCLQVQSLLEQMCCVVNVDRVSLKHLVELAVNAQGGF